MRIVSFFTRSSVSQLVVFRKYQLRSQGPYRNLTRKTKTNRILAETVPTDHLPVELGSGLLNTTTQLAFFPNSL